jgi:hypothetical protein
MKISKPISKGEDRKILSLYNSRGSLYNSRGDKKKLTESITACDFYKEDEKHIIY